MHYVLLAIVSTACLLATSVSADDKQVSVSNRLQHNIDATASLTNNNKVSNSFLSIEYAIAHTDFTNTLAYKQLEYINDTSIISDYSQWRNLLKYVFLSNFYLIYYVKQAHDVIQDFYLEKTDSFGAGAYLLDNNLEINLSVGVRSDKLGRANLIRPSIQYTINYEKLALHIGYSYLHTDIADLIGAEIKLQYLIASNINLIIKFTSEVYKVADALNMQYEFNRHYTSIGMSYRFNY